MEPLSAYLYLAGKRMAAGLSGWFGILSGIAARYVEILASVFLWKWVYQKRESLYGLREEQMIAWMILAAGLTVFYSTNVHLKLRREVRRGGHSLLYPCSTPALFLAGELGRTGGRVLTGCVPVVALGAVTFGLAGPAGGEELLLAACFAAAGWLMLFLMYAIVGASSCWLMELGELGVAFVVLVAFLSGSMLPLEFFPGPVREALFWLPFRYAFQTPISLYLGRLSAEEGMRELGGMLIWLLLLAVVWHLVWESVRERLRNGGRE